MFSHHVVKIECSRDAGKKSNREGKKALSKMKLISPKSYLVLGKPPKPISSVSPKRTRSPKLEKQQFSIRRDNIKPSTQLLRGTPPKKKQASPAFEASFAPHFATGTITVPFFSRSRNKGHMIKTRYGEEGRNGELGHTRSVEVRRESRRHEDPPRNGSKK